MSKPAILICAAAILSCTAAEAQTRSNAGRFLEGADANHDGTITRAEFIALRTELFERWDRDGDGYADAPRRRLAARSVSRPGAGLREQLDADGDGRVSRSEFVDGPTRAFDRADGNHDGRLDRDEIAAQRRR